MRFFIIIYALALSGILSAQDIRVQQLNDLFDQLYEEGRFNGNVLIAEKGEVIYNQSFGFADIKNNRELTTNTVFDIASVTKEFTAVGITILHKQGKLEYDDPISKFIPELEFYGPVTVRQLIHHTSGLPLLFPTFQKHWQTSKIAVNTDVVNLFAENKPEANFQANTNFEYNNTNYVLLGLIIERISGMSYSDFLRKHIFEPLEMNRTQVYCRYYDGYEISDYALGYMPDKTRNAMAVDDVPDTDYRKFLDGIVGAGQIKSTVEDLLKWDRALYTDKIIDELDKGILFSSTKLNDGKIINYGFGWVIKQDETFGKIIYHPGRWGGYINHFERDIDNDITIIVLTNNDLPKTIIPRNRIRNILYGIEEARAPIDILAKYEGFYKNKNDESLTLRVEGNDLYYIGSENDIFRMMPKSDTEFIASRYLFDVKFEFSKTDKGELSVKFISTQDGSEKVFVLE